MKTRTHRLSDELVIKIGTRAQDGEHSVEQVLRRLLKMGPAKSKRPRSIFETVAAESEE